MKTFMLLLSGCILMTACKNEQAPAPATGAIDCSVAKITTAYVFGVVQANCTDRKCHPGGNSPVIADFSTTDKLKGYISTQRAIFLLRVTSPQADMPQSQLFPALSRGMRDSIACWVGHGMPDQ
ncbi:hypothetical protein [Chitinophaga sp. MM2321]|uniref:hypothetical protein n=1 Tax=Chitinophaga sp. MM2321 TaxID=3137178 RepID=UPI0032D570DE